MMAELCPTGLWKPRRLAPGPGLLALMLVVLLALSVPVQAQERGPTEEDPHELARQGIEQLMRALDGFVRMIPQYDLPEMTEDGDIIIRRRQPGEQPRRKHRKPPEVEETDT